MQKLSKVNQGVLNSQPLHAVPIVGMAALWVSLFKQLLYPVLYAYYRTGDESALIAQGAYSVALVAVAFGLLIAHTRLNELVGQRRWIVVALGLGGASGIALRAFADPGLAAGEVAMCLGAVLSAVYLPVHFAFWALYARRLEGNDTTRTVALSFALFLVVYGVLTAMGANSVYTSIACPIVSATMAFCCPKPEEGAAEGPASAVAVEPEGAPSEPTASIPVPDSESAPEPASAPELPAGFAEAFDLSEREAELAAYAHRNWSARRIAGELFIAESTVYTHLKRIYRKTDVHSKHELIDLIDAWQRKG